MKVLVIGGAGYIGSHTALAFFDRGYDVTVYDNLSTGRRENIISGMHFIEGDILDEKWLRSTMARGFDGVVHLAAFKAAGESMVVPEKYSVNNISGTINILNVAAAAGVRRIVFSSSAAVYGEPQYLPIDESHPLEPVNYYGFTKLEIERILGWYDRLKGIRFAALRYFNAAGYDLQQRLRGLERNPANLLPILMEVCAGWRDHLDIYGTDYDTADGTCIRDYIHVSDLADAHVTALEKLVGNDTSFIVNLGSEHGVSVKSMVEAARRITGKSIAVKYVGRRPGDPAALVASAGLARQQLGWQTRFSDVDTIIGSAWKVYQSVSCSSA